MLLFLLFCLTSSRHQDMYMRDITCCLYNFMSMYFIVCIVHDFDSFWYVCQFGGCILKGYFEDFGVE